MSRSSCQIHKFDKSEKRLITKASCKVPLVTNSGTMIDMNIFVK